MSESPLTVLTPHVDTHPNYISDAAVRPVLGALKPTNWTLLEHPNLLAFELDQPETIAHFCFGGSFSRDVQSFFVRRVNILLGGIFLTAVLSEAVGELLYQRSVFDVLAKCKFTVSLVSFVVPVVLCMELHILCLLLEQGSDSLITWVNITSA